MKFSQVLAMVVAAIKGEDMSDERTVEMVLENMVWKERRHTLFGIFLFLVGFLLCGIYIYRGFPTRMVCLYYIYHA